MARGLKSGISLTVVPPTVPGARPAPPAELDDIEARIWKDIVAALPPTWLNAAAREVLVRAVAQAGVCESLEAQLRELRRQPNPDLEALGSLAARHAASAKSLSQLLGVLRATPRARMLSRGASRQIAQVARVRPWEASSDG
jgi:hypothetical protein